MSGAEECLQAAASKQRSHGWLGIADFCASVPICGLSPCEDLIRYLAAPEWLRPAEEEWLQTYAEQMRQAALELRCGGEVLLVSPPPLGEALGSLEFDLGAKMAKAVEAVAADVGCGYVPLFEACVKFLQRSREVDSSAGTRGYSLAEFLPRLCLLPWRLYVGQQSLSQIQAEEETKLTLDLVHFGDSYAQLAADLLEEKLGLLK
ncbi:unnamed protein product [Durusdinium trenchii]|uniref:Uncharacterized protein n=1 Tax=Durusdinium trenchii TaxID=1381693 RepID=A0ABP0QX81_9DINO